LPDKLDYEDNAAWEALFGTKPIYRDSVREISSKFFPKGFSAGVPKDYFAIVAEAKVKIPAGRYVFSTISDDGIRVFIDGREIISRWNRHSSEYDEAEVEIAEGVHEVRVQYCQGDGLLELAFDWERVQPGYKTGSAEPYYTESEVMIIADDYVRNRSRGIDLSYYPNRKPKYDERAGSWRIFYWREPNRYPGDHFTVIIHDKTLNIERWGGL
jgi:hypothetical protein